MAANLGQEESRAGTRSRLGDVRLLCLRPLHVEYCCFGKPCYEHVSGCHLVMQPDREVRGIVQEIEKKKNTAKPLESRDDGLYAWLVISRVVVLPLVMVAGIGRG